MTCEKRIGTGNSAVYFGPANRRPRFHTSSSRSCESSERVSRFSQAMRRGAESLNGCQSRSHKQIDLTPAAPSTESIAASDASSTCWDDGSAALCWLLQQLAFGVSFAVSAGPLQQQHRSLACSTSQQPHPWQVNDWQMNDEEPGQPNVAIHVRHTYRNRLNRHRDDQ